MEEKQEIYRPSIKVKTSDTSTIPYACGFNTGIYLDDKPVRVSYFKMEASAHKNVEVTMTFLPKDINIDLEQPITIIRHESSISKILNALRTKLKTK